ncbi:MAG: IclR family transcriptional regulator [Opitutaceae bacterium]|nr:IclR family transcriptional regulator [Opitutaceae bacterium]
MPKRPLRATTPEPRAEATSSERYVIPNLRNACRILKFLGQQKEGVKSADVARSLGVPVTTTLRILTTLHLEGLVRKEDGRFKLGPVMIQLGSTALAETEIRELALPVLERLSQATIETAHVAIPCDKRALILAVQDSPHPLRAASRPGFLAELHCSATGKIFLSHLYQNEIASLLEEHKPTKRTPNTLVTAAELQRETQAVRNQGYSVDEEEFHPGVRCLAAPVYGSSGQVVAAIGITAATVRFTRERIPEIAAIVQAAARELSEKLGAHT